MGIKDEGCFVRYNCWTLFRRTWKEWILESTCWILVGHLFSWIFFSEWLGTTWHFVEHGSPLLNQKPCRLLSIHFPQLYFGRQMRLVEQCPKWHLLWWTVGTYANMVLSTFPSWPRCAGLAQAAKNYQESFARDFRLHRLETHHMSEITAIHLWSIFAAFSRSFAEDLGWRSILEVFEVALSENGLLSLCSEMGVKHVYCWKSPPDDLDDISHSATAGHRPLGPWDLPMPSGTGVPFA